MASSADPAPNTRRWPAGAMLELRRARRVKLANQQLREKVVVAKPFPFIVQCDEKLVLTFKPIQDVPAILPSPSPRRTPAR